MNWEASSRAFWREAIVAAAVLFHLQGILEAQKIHSVSSPSLEVNWCCRKRSLLFYSFISVSDSHHGGAVWKFPLTPGESSSCKVWVRGCSFLTYTTRSPSSVKNASLQGRDAAIPGHSQQSEGLKEGQNGWEHEIPSKPELRAATADLYSKSHNSWAWMSPSPSRRDKVVEMAEPGYPR